ncbi:MAG TPA: helix-turn-helix transcriptional regulator [Polyangiaceae bacterium]
MIVRTPRDIGALIREQRKRLELDQQTLADRAGVSRKWLSAVEQGKSSAELGLVLRTLSALGLELDAAERSSRQGGGTSAVDIDAIVNLAKKKRK